MSEVIIQSYMNRLAETDRAISELRTKVDELLAQRSDQVVALQNIVGKRFDYQGQTWVIFEKNGRWYCRVPPTPPTKSKSATNPQLPALTFKHKGAL